MKLKVRLLPLLFLLLVGGSVFFFPSSSKAGDSPYDVPSSVRTNWETTLGGKTYVETTGRNLVYDVYYSKYISGGHRVINKDFGKGSQPYLEFRGWAVLFGHKKHTETNQDTYIVARKISDSSGTEKVYGTVTRGLSATEDLEYNNQGSGLYNECSASTTNVQNTTCNMRYDYVGFDAYLPLNELFPNSAESATWRLYLVKRVDSHIVYTPLILPFEFDNRAFNGGELSLSSGQNTNTLVMNNDGVLRRSYPREAASAVVNRLGSDRYFTKGTTYTKLDAEETKTAVWYGVKSPKDSNATRWAATSYWRFTGDQAVLKYTKEDVPPVHISDSITNHRYKDGINYWVQPNDSVTVTLRQRDVDSGNKYQYIKITGTDLDIRSRHDFKSSSTTDNYHWMKDSDISINAAKRTENTSYGRVEWTVQPKVHGKTYAIRYHYVDLAGNAYGYDTGASDTGDRIKVDGVDPVVSFRNSGDTANFHSREWDKASITVKLKHSDANSGYKRSRYAWSKSTATPTSWSAYSTSSDYNVTRSTKGQWYLHVQSEDNVGNVLTTYKGPYKLNNPPVANFSHSPSTIYNNTTVSFTNSSTDADGDSLTYQWAYQQPGSTTWTNFSTAVNPTRVFNIKGTWNIRLTVSDGITSHSVTKTLTVVNRPPVANFSFSPTTIYNDTNVNFTNASTDADGDSLTYQWAYQSPGSTTWTNFSTAVNPARVFNIKGTWNIRLTASDGTTSHSVTKTLTVVNRPPVANFSFSPSTIYNDTTVTFIDASTDPDGDSLTYQWAYQQPGTTSWTNFSTAKNPTRVLNIKGKWAIRLTVTDVSGATATAIKNPVVVNRPPAATITYTPADPYEGDTINLCVTPTDADKDLLTVKIFVKKDGGAEQTVLNKGSITTGSQQCYSFVSQVGRYDIRATVNDGTAEVTASTWFYSKPLIINGYVKHTPLWLAKHQELGNAPYQFYSGEKFLLEADISPYPTVYVKSTLTAVQSNGIAHNPIVPLNKVSNVLFNGELFNPAYLEYPTNLKVGAASFEFEVKYANGVIKKATVPIEIISDTYEAYQLHRRY